MTEQQLLSVIDCIEAAGCDYKRDLPLSSCSTFKIGGAAEIAIYPHNSLELEAAVSYLVKNNIRFDVFGNCSNVLFDDKGYRGAIVFTSKMRSMEIVGNVIRASAGCNLNAVANAAMKAGLSGLEFAYGIPGTVGGAVYMNAGAYEKQVDDVLLNSLAYDYERCEMLVLDRGEHDYAYRHSYYMGKPLIALEATFKLQEGDIDEIEQKMSDYMARRRTKQPLEFPNAGSIFKRCSGHFIGKLIDEAGLKGTRIGGAEISEKHAGFIVNRGDATASDVLALIDFIKNEIMKRHSIALECEVQYIPYE